MSQLKTESSKRMFLWVFLAIILATILMVAAIWSQSYVHPVGTPIVTFSPTPVVTSYPANDVKPAAAGYLGLSSGGESKIYLVSASASYATYPTDLVQQLTNETIIRKGDPCFTLNLTLRNDYTANDTIPGNWGPFGNNTGQVWLSLNVSLFDGDGRQVTASDITHADFPFPNRDQFGMSDGEIVRISLVLSTSDRSIDHYDITLGYLGLLPIP